MKLLFYLFLFKCLLTAKSFPKPLTSSEVPCTRLAKLSLPSSPRVSACSGLLLQPACSHSPVTRLLTQHLCTRNLQCVGHLPGAKDRNRSKTLHHIPLNTVPSPLCGNQDPQFQTPHLTSLPVSSYMYKQNTSHSRFFRQVLFVSQIFPFHPDWSLRFCFHLSKSWDCHSLWHLPHTHLDMILPNS